MLVTVVATMCSLTDPTSVTPGPESCITAVVTDQATMMECEGAFAAQVLPHWMEEQGYTARGYHLVKWGCVIGGTRRSTI